MNEEVNSLSNQAEKLLDHVQEDVKDLGGSASAERYISVAGVLAELAKAHAMVELADAIRDTLSYLEVKVSGTHDSTPISVTVL